MTNKHVKVFAAGLLASAGILAARADTLTWDPGLSGGSGGNGTWNLNTTANWWNGAADEKWLDTSASGTNSAQFSGNAGTVTLNTSLSTSNLQFTTSGYTLSGSGMLTLGAGGIDTSALSSGTTTIGIPLLLPASQQAWQVGSGSILAINGSVRRNPGAGVDFTSVGAITASPNLTNDAGGIIDGWATTGNFFSSQSSGDFLSVSNGNVITCTNYLAVSASGSTTLSTATISGQNLVSGALNGANEVSTIAANVTINSLVQQGDFVINNGVTVTLGSGGLLMRGVSRWLIAQSANSLGSAVLESGLPTGEFFIHMPDGGNDIVGNSSAAGNWRIWPQINDNGVTPAIVIKDGPGMVSLQNTNTYSGGTVINNGILTSGVDENNSVIGHTLGTGTVTINGPALLELGFGTANANVDYVVTNSVAISGGSVVANDGHQHLSGPVNILAGGATFGSTYDGGADPSTGNKAFFLDGVVSGSGPVAIEDAYQAGESDRYGNANGNTYNSSVVEFGNNANTYSGTVTLVPYTSGSGAGSYVAVNGSTALQFATLNLVNNTGGQRYAGSSGTFTPLIFNTGLGSATLGAITGSGNIILNGFNENTYALNTDPIALTVGGNNVSSTDTGIITGSGSLTKVGSGTLTLSGATTYTGNTAVSGGTLALAANFVTSTNITVGAGAMLDVSALGTVTLSGSQNLFSAGTLNGSLNTTSGTQIHADTGSGYGTNAVTGSLTLASGVLTYVSVGTRSAGSNDLITVGGTLTANNNVVHVKAPNTSASLQTSDYVLFSSSNPISGSFASAPSWDVQPVNAANFSIVTSGNKVLLHYTASTGPTGGGIAAPATVVRNQNVFLSVTATNGNAGTVSSVVVDTSAVGGSTTFALVSAGGNVWTNTVTVAPTTLAGALALIATLTDTASLSGSVSIPLTVVVGNDVWDGAAADNNFSSNLNWTNQTAPGYLGDSLEFAGSTRLTPNMNNNYTVTGVTFDNSAGSFNIGTGNGSTLTLSQNGVVNNSANTQAINVPVTIPVTETFNASSGNIALGSTLSGAGSISKIGNGALTLGGAGSSLTGNLVVNAGSVGVTGGSITFGSGVSSVGYLTGNGNMTMTGGSLTNGGEFRVGASDQNGTGINATGSVSVANATLSLGSLTVARGNNPQNTISGMITLNGGSTVNSEGDCLIDFAGGVMGKVVVNGGTLNVASTIKRWMIVSEWDFGSAEVDVNGGQVNLNASTDIRFATQGNTGTNVFNLNSGAVTFYSDDATTVGGSGVVDMHQGTGTTVNNTFNLNGGTLTVSGILSATTTGTRTFNFNGGTLTANGANSTYLSLGTGSATANVRNGGAIINDGGFSIGISQPLLHSAIAGDSAVDGGLVKLGAGTLSLSGTETYNGATMVNNGTLSLTGSINNSTNIYVGSGATFDVSGVSFTLGANQSLSGSGFNNGSVNTTAGSTIYAGTDGTYGTNTFNSDLTLVSGVACYLDVGTTYNGNNDQIVVSGNLTASGNAIHLRAPSSSSSLDTTADYVLITSPNTISGSFASAPIWTVAPANAGHYSIVTGPNMVTLHYSATSLAPSVTASANPSTVSANQNTLITATVTPGSASIATVTVDLSALGGSTVSLVRSNSSSLYTNSVAIPATATAGNVSVTVTATDTASLSGSATIPLTITATSEVWNGSGANGNWSTNPNWASGFAPALTGDSIVFAGATGLTPNMDNNYTVTGITFSNTAGSFNIGSANSSTLTMTGSGSIVNNSASPQTLNVPVADTGGGITKSGTGEVTLAGANTYTGQTTINAGALNISGSVASTGNTVVGNAAGNSVLDISGSISPYYMLVGNVSGAVGAVYQTGGAVSANSSSGYDNLSLGNVPGSFGYYDALGGTFAVNGIAIAGEANNGTASSFGLSGNGIMDVNGGSVTDSGWLVMARNNSATNGAEIGILNVFSGSLSYAGGGLVGPWDTGETAIINVLGGTVNNTAAVGVYLGNTGSTGILNLNGGLLEASIITGYNGPTYSPVTYGELNFNGGTLQASAASGGLIQVSTASIYSGGATIDNNGFAVSISQPLLAPAGNGVRITSFTGGAGYIAPPIIIVTNAISDTTGFGATAIAQINPLTGTVTNIIVTCPGQNYTATPSFVMSGGGATTPANVTGAMLVANVSGGLTAVGSGVTALSGANTYTGNTTVNAGTLEIVQPVLATGSTVTVASGAVLQLDFAGVNFVNGLILNGVSQASGVYNRTNAPSYITGTGSLEVGVAIASNPTNMVVRVTGSTMALSWPADHLGWILQQQTNSMAVGLGTNWVDVAGSASITSTNINIKSSSPAVFYRLRRPY